MTKRTLVALVAVGGVAGLAVALSRKAKASERKTSPASVPPSTEPQPAPSPSGGGGSTGPKFPNLDYPRAYKLLSDLGYSTPGNLEGGKYDAVVHQFQQDFNAVYTRNDEVGQALRARVTEPLAEDGILGPKTANALEAANDLTLILVAGNLLANFALSNQAEAWEWAVQGALQEA